jgi:hypothetical protein
MLQLPPFRYQTNNAALYAGASLASVVITSSTTFSVLENTTAVATLTATGGGTITWSLTGGADIAKFTINSSSGALAFGTAPDFEMPTDADGNNIYLVQVRATNGVTSDTKSLSITVTDVVETVPDPNFGFVVYLSGYEGADASTATVDEAKGKTGTTVGNAQIDTAQFKFGTSSLLLDGTGDYLSLDDHNDWWIGANQFTIEMWIRFASLKTTAIMSQIASGGNFKNFVFYWSPSPLLAIDVGNATGAPGFSLSGPWAAAVNTWYHIAVERDAANKFRLYVNGTMVASVVNATVMFNSPEPLNIGRLVTDAAQDFNGWLDEVRFTNGIARYASDAGFTVPTAAFPRHGSVVAIISPTSFSRVQSTTAVTTLRASGGLITWSIVGGADASKFSINSASGELAFIVPPNFAVPTDANGDNVYDVQVNASNPSASDTKTINVTVTSAAVTTSYANPGGQGNRLALIGITTTATMATDPINTILNGSMAATTWFNGGQSGREIKFDFWDLGGPKVLTEAKWYQTNGTSQGTWKWQGSNDNSSYTDIGGTFTLGSPATTVITTLSANTTPYRYYKLLQVSGSTSSSPDLAEIEFKLD